MPISDRNDTEFYDLYWKKKKVRCLQVSKNLKILEFKRLAGLHSLNGGRLLDVGCGDGRLVVELSSKFRVSAFDYSSETISRNKKLIDNVEFSVRDAISPVAENEKRQFEVVTCMDVIEHVGFDSQEQLVKNISDFLVPGGILIVSTPDRDQALRYKKDSSESEENFLKRYEGQPCADCLTSDEFDSILRTFFSIEYSCSVSPTAPLRVFDLSWKALSLLAGYRGINRISKSLSIPGRYMVRLCKKL